jgi:hypothetical protein
MHDIANNARDSNVVTLTPQPHKSNGTLLPARLSDRVDKLCEILGKINSKEVDIKAGKLVVLRLALDAGGHLIAIKDDVANHRKFGAWVDANLKCTSRTASTYIKLAENRDLIEAQIGSASVFSIRGALRLINSKKPTHPKHAAVNDPAAPYSTEALQKLSASERAQLSANLPNEIKVEIVAHAVAQTQRTTDKHETENRDLAWECVGAISKILATKARPECKIEDIKDALNNILKRTLPVMDHEASYH